MAQSQPRDGRKGSVDSISRFLADNTTSMIDGLATWAAIPSVADDAERLVDVARSAHWLAGEMRDVGLSTALLPAGDGLAVYGEWIVDPDAPTVLVYSHHDVRHAKSEEWQETGPYKPVLRDGRLYGRGTSDAKGQVIAHLWGLRAHLACADDGLPVLNVKYLVEAEEEAGSPHLKSLLEEYRDKLDCDLIVFSDTVQWKKTSPAAVTSVRGMIGATLCVSGPGRDVHSGVVSGAAPNPIHALAGLIHDLHDSDGRVALGGFYDPVEELSPARRRDLEDLPFDEGTWISRTETRHVSGESGHSVKERLWARPTLEVLSILAGDPTGIPRAVIPAKATATMSIRTVPDQRVSEVAAQLRAFVAARLPSTVSYELTIDDETAQEPYVTPEGPALKAVARATERGYGKKAVGRMGNAGGGPADLLATLLDAPVVFVGTGLPEDRWHASDESIEIDMLVRGAATIAHLWCELGSLGREGIR